MSSNPLYTLRFPFQLAPGREINDLDQPVERKIGNLTFKLKHHEPYYVFEVQGFESEQAAKKYLDHLWAGLMWVLLHSGLAFNAIMEFDAVTYAEDPIKAAENLSKSLGVAIQGGVDGLVNGNWPSVYPSSKTIRTITAGGASITVGTNVEQVYSLLTEGLGTPNSANVILDAKLRIALDLYAAYFYERSANARLLTLVMALETLTPSHPKHQVALDLIDHWRLQVEQEKSVLQPDSVEYEALKALERELLFRKEASLRSQIRTLVHDILAAEGHHDAVQIARRAVKVYDNRSTLVHEGTLPENELRVAERDAKEIVEAVLRAKFRQVAG
jgi:hypothetical protein